MMVNLKLIIGFLIVGLMTFSACGPYPPINDCNLNSDCLSTEYCSDGVCESCRTPVCDEPEAGCHYESIVFENGCKNPCAELVCENNEAPIVDANSNIETIVGESVELNGVVSDDGLPNNELTINWVSVSGPTSYDLEDWTDPKSIAYFEDPGVYVLRLTASDGQLSSSDEVTVTAKLGTPAPTCNDKIKNQDETGVDCGGSCQACAEPLPKALLSYDFSETVKNSRVTENVKKLSGYDLTISGGDYESLNGGLWIKGDTIMKASGKTLANELIKAGTFSVEVYFEPEDLIQEGPARIITLSKDGSFRDFTLGQVKDGLQWRVRTENTDTNGGPSAKRVEISEVLEPKPVHVVALYDGMTSKVYVNGVLAGKNAIGGDLINWDTSYEFAFGNEINTDARPWAGTLFKAAVYDYALNDNEIKTLYNNRKN